MNERSCAAKQSESQIPGRNLLFPRILYCNGSIYYEPKFGCDTSTPDLTDYGRSALSRVSSSLEWLRWVQGALLSSHCKGVPRCRTSAYTCRLFNWDGREISSIFKQFAVGNLKKIFLRSRWEDTFPHNRTQISSSRRTAVSTLATDLSFPLSICFEGKVPDYHEENTMYGWPLFRMIVFPYYLTGLFFKTHLPYCCLLYYGSPLKFCQCE